MRPQKLQPPIPPDELNHHTGFTGTIVGRINKFCKHEDVQNGIDQKAQARKRKETSDSQIEGHKNRITVGLLASAQTLPLDQIFLLLHWNGSEFFRTLSLVKRKQKGNKNSIPFAYIEGTEQNKRTNVCGRIEINGALVQTIR